jgi:hypothetical protein
MAVVIHQAEMLWTVQVYAVHPHLRTGAQFMVQWLVHLEHFISLIMWMAMGIHMEEWLWVGIVLPVQMLLQVQMVIPGLIIKQI